MKNEMLNPQMEWLVTPRSAMFSLSVKWYPAMKGCFDLQCKMLQTKASETFHVWMQWADSCVTLQTPGARISIEEFFAPSTPWQVTTLTLVSVLCVSLRETADCNEQQYKIRQLYLKLRGLYLNTCIKPHKARCFVLQLSVLLFMTVSHLPQKNTQNWN